MLLFGAIEIAIAPSILLQLSFLGGPRIETVFKSSEWWLLWILRMFSPEVEEARHKKTVLE